MSIKDMMEQITLPADNSLAPGEARCPGRSVADLLSNEDSRNDPGLMDSSYQFMGDEDVPFSRYTSQDFYDEEMQHLWPRVWQWACREEHVPQPGDFYVYDIGHNSAIVVRGVVN
ncbi:MAG: hypothetical protein JJ956_19800 [Pseudomonadales bacterium]|nr:hypothetical protein [Pseudomonadales bacterium]